MLPQSIPRPVSAQGATLWLAIVSALTTLACEEDKAPTAPPGVAAQSVSTAPAVVGGFTPQGTIALPVDQTFSGRGLAFGITQIGTGPNGLFKISKGTSGQDALLAQTNGIGYAFHAVASGNGGAAKFENTRAGNGSNTLFAAAAGGGSAVSAVNTGAGQAGFFVKTATTGTTSALFVQTAGQGNAVEGRATREGTAGFFENAAAMNGSHAIFGRTKGTGDAADFEINNASSAASATHSVTNGIGWAGEFRATSTTAGGVLIETKGGPGLQIFGGTKNAVVGTTTGARALYTEESSEVWFTDYGFGKLTNGRARILIDPGFAQTVSLDQPYHVFVQPYGPAELYVEARTDLGFVIMVKDGDPNVEFGYRLVARRQGFETKRLERAPWADNRPAFGLEPAR